ncbi:MAG TPA: KH domain-containing protein [Acidimicrobiia bacterium]|nr:KH domain-containing protein [Acidimicrobiia bacterium]
MSDPGVDDDVDEIAPEGNRIVGARARAVVEHVARAVAEDPDAVEVDLEERPGEVQLLIRTNPSDMGRLIGKRGRVIQALRQVTRAAGAAEGVKANVDVLE